MKSSLETAIENASKLRIVRIYESKSKLFFYHFFIGMSYGLGVFFGASVVVALAVLVLSKFQWIPFIGDFIVQVMHYLESARARY